MIIHVAREGKPFGTFHQREIQEGILSGYFVKTDLVWKSGMKQWRPIGEVVRFLSAEGEMPGLPWEQRSKIEFWKAFYQTTRAILFSPRIAFSKMKVEGGLLNPLSFCFVAASLFLFFLIVLSILLGIGSSNLASETGLSKGSVTAIIGGAILIVNVIVFLSVILISIVTHLIIKITKSSKLPIEATLRVSLYLYGATMAFLSLLFVVIYLLCLTQPVKINSHVAINTLIVFLIWEGKLLAIGLEKVHQLLAWRSTMVIVLSCLMCGITSIKLISILLSLIHFNLKM